MRFMPRIRHDPGKAAAGNVGSVLGKTHALDGAGAQNAPYTARHFLSHRSTNAALPYPLPHGLSLSFVTMHSAAALVFAAEVLLLDSDPARSFRSHKSGRRVRIYGTRSASRRSALALTSTVGIRGNKAAGTSQTEPEFAEPIQNITVPAGRKVTLACVVDNLNNYRVSALLPPIRDRDAAGGIKNSVLLRYWRALRVQ
ncbi:hypothetical protein HPB50_008297 [Hyalomma asiaticum]|uniref:Uncharacterized protein n=1 Tax=Hyalomma asiaticum TaxID=266040 RepID=A0ACB7SUG6_HYAAI|nr:hypothetical protein HPB50_008297 [Hyalomma asiaticum]